MDKLKRKRRLIVIRNGRRVMIYSNGDKYIGQWKDSKRNG